MFVLYSERLQSEEDQDAERRKSQGTSPRLDASDAEDDISVGDNCSDTSTKNTSYHASPDKYSKKLDSDEAERLSPLEYELNTRIPNSNYDSPFKENESEFESRNEDRMKMYEGGIFQLYRGERGSRQDEGAEGSAVAGAGFARLDTIYGRSMDLSKNAFQTQLLAGFASVMAGNSQRDSQESSGIVT